MRSIGQNECINHFGNLCNVDRFLAIRSRHDFAFFKDAADSIGSKFYGKLAGNMGYFNGFSFHGTKAMTTGEGGVFFTFTYDRQRGLAGCCGAVLPSLILSTCNFFRSSASAISLAMSATGIFRGICLPIFIPSDTGFLYAPSWTPSKRLFLHCLVLPNASGPSMWLTVFRLGSSWMQAIASA